jgi:hypothetical protein
VQRLARPLFALLLIGEGLASGTLLLGRLPVFAAYNAPTLAVLAARMGVSVLEFASGWMILHRVPVAVRAARVVLLASAALRAIELGAGAAPTNLFPTFRWPVVVLYGIYAGCAALFMGPDDRG